MLRCIAQQDRKVGIVALTENEQKGVVHVDLYNQEREELRKASDIVGRVKVILTKEPWFIILPEREYSIRVNHLSDVEFIEHHDNCVPTSWKPKPVGLDTAVDVKARGHATVGRKDHRKAIPRVSMRHHVSGTC
jgi:hypothetical protein